MSEFIDLGIHWPPTTTAGQPVLRTMVVCDLSDSTALVERLGDRRAAALLRKHDRLTRALIDEHGGREIDKTDGYLLLFERPTQAVAFALAYQRGLRFMSEAEEVTVRARVGIHVGDVVMWENSPEDISRGAKPVEVEGLAKPVAARLASLARPRQILLSGVAASIARRGHEEIAEDCPEARWCSHGTYRIRGVAEPLEVIQIGEPVVADFSPPRNRTVGRRLLPWWRRGVTLATAAAILALAIGLTTWIIARQPPKIAFAARDWVVIADVDNQTGQSEFNNTISTAIRIGLQQSRYVNVIPPKKMHQTLERMKLDSSSRVNIKIGSEIALRDNARALIAPMISNDRSDYLISAQIIDPSNLKPVRSISIRASDEQSIIPAISKLVVKIRQNLGESLAQVKSTSIPLEQVTTTSLEALRAYSLAQQAYASGNYNLSVDLLNHALKMDNTFASAYAAMASDYLVMGQSEQARTAINKALKYSTRLTPLERMKLHAKWTMIFKSKMAATTAWKVIADLYPDDAVSANNTGLTYAAYLNDCESALPYLQHAVKLPQTFRPASTYILATCQLATGKAEAAIKNYKYAYKEGFRGQFLSLADAYVETHQYTNASDFLSKVPIDPGTLVSLATRRALVLTDQGDLAGAESGLNHALDTITQDSKSQGWRLRLDLVGILWARGKKSQALKLARSDLLRLLNMKDSERENTSIDYPSLLALYSRWVARLGDTDLASKGVQVASTDNNLRGNPVRSQLVSVAQAEIALDQGDLVKAENIAMAADSHPLWELLEVIARIDAKMHSPNTMKAYARVINARPLAFGELMENQLGICTRSAQWNLTLLAAAKYLEHKSPSESSRYASLFLDRWRLAPSNLPSIKAAHELLQIDTAHVAN